MKTVSGFKSWIDTQFFKKSCCHHNSAKSRYLTGTNGRYGFHYHHPNQIPVPWTQAIGKKIAPAIRKPHEALTKQAAI